MTDNSAAVRNGLVPRVFRVTDYGARRDSGEDSARGIAAAITAASSVDGPVVIEFPCGRYDIFPQEVARAPYYVSNTASEEEYPDPVKTIGLLLRGMNRFRIEGNGSLLVFHGRMTPIVLDGCREGEICNLSIDFARPTISEMRITEVGERYWDAEVHPDSCYELADGALHWTGEGWSHRGGPAQEYDPVSNRTWRVPNPVATASRIEEVRPGKLRLWFREDAAADTAVGRVFQMRDGIRDQVGALIVGCRDIAFRDVWMRYMHGLGIVGQFSENLTFERLKLAPDPSSGRTAAAFADFLHLSGVKGKVTVSDSRFDGAHDDAINIHGTHLRIMSSDGGRRIRVRFMHPQSYGFQAFHAGDEIEFIHADTLRPYAARSVVAVYPISLREVELELDAPAPETKEGDVVENATWTPEVHIRGNSFSRIPTRGILLTTRRQSIIAHNRFEKMAMSAVLIADDAGSWYESGMVRHVEIKGNRFIACGSANAPVILIHPENTVWSADQPVHQHIVIRGNRFEGGRALLLEAKSTEHLIFADNEIAGASCEAKCSDDQGDSLKRWISLTACSEVAIIGNAMGDEELKESEAGIVSVHDMEKRHIRACEGLHLVVADTRESFQT
ncbi:right-handed parallel beta-helix repeat-containing protein [Paenibacillus sp. J5C_2022]|uniref:right-handed parallel beta-helix repeat-containing protein n=1 Tax=Paenibacillus sp. J5C2022 TaxID=2977129 RepID=UPI0021CE58C8|nr:right-handed parallel beta-helix repeat-containing protein [Paenibacillus sp. J5C2022]MCU6707743.1 right-handed parallel beta-helix repeat-containing protein [Paenibacillus sp. J5C2022]